MKRLIVNADDYGFDPGIDDGILAAHARGIVTATSCLVGSARFPAAATRARRDARALDCGLHLDLTWATPSAREPLPHLAPGGRFRSKRGLFLALTLGRIPGEEILAECRAQLAAFAAEMGRPSHVDVHQHFHLFAVVHAALITAARDAGVPFIRHPDEPAGGGAAARLVSGSFRRRPRPAPPPRIADHFRGLAGTGRQTAARLLAVIASLQGGLTELMVHPGLGGASDARDRLASRRAAECEALCDPALRPALDAAGIGLTTFAAAADTP